MKRIGLFGGSFDPVHNAHLALAHAALRDAALDEVRWIPAGHPWQKARHHKRRIVQPRVRDLVWSRLVEGGFWHLATDWAEYAEQMQACLAEDPRWSGGPIERPTWRPETRYERRAVREGRDVTDLMYVRHA